jgi:hypothetical protein
MIFDDINRPAPPREERSRRRRSQSRHREQDNSRRRRRSSFESASNFSGEVRDRGDRSTVAWLSMLAVLVLAVGGFALYLQQEKGSRTPLPGVSPSGRLLPFIDPVLAPLETGNVGYEPEALNRIAAELQAAKETAGRDDQEVYAVGGTIASILQESVQDRARHLQRLVELGSPVSGLSEGGQPSDPAKSETQIRHLELAVGVSWQRNSVAYRNRVEEMWYRLLHLEQDRFRGGSASAAMVPPLPTHSAND